MNEDEGKTLQESELAMRGGMAEVRKDEMADGRC